MNIYILTKNKAYEQIHTFDHLSLNTQLISQSNKNKHSLIKITHSW